MVKATRGVLVTCDPAVKQILLQLDQEERPSQRFLIADLDETHVLIAPDAVDRVREELDEVLEKNHFNPLAGDEE